MAAIAENRARRFSLFGILFSVFFPETGGWADLPPTVPGARAALWLAPLVLGILDMPRPTPLDSAVVLFPAIGFLPWGWNLRDCIARTARFMTSGLKGVSKTFGSFIFPMEFPVRSKIFLVLTMFFHYHFPCGDSSDMYVICGGCSGMCFGGRVG